MYYVIDADVTLLRLTLLEEQASANSVPAAAVIRGMQALSGIIGRKAPVGCLVSLLLKARA